MYVAFKMYRRVLIEKYIVQSNNLNISICLRLPVDGSDATMQR